MGGFSVITGDPYGSVMNADNASFDGTERGGVMTSNGQLWIGSVVAPHVRLGTLSSPDGSITFTLGNGIIGLSVNGGTTTGKTITGDSGGPLAPTLGNWNIFGRSGSKTSGSGSTLTINSPPYADFPATSTATINSGSFITAGGNIILNLPSTAADGDLVEVVCTTANLVAIDVPVNNFIRIGTLITSSGGTATSTQIGDAICLRYRLSDLTWYATSLIGTWVMA